MDCIINSIPYCVNKPNIKYSENKKLNDKGRVSQNMLYSNYVKTVPYKTIYRGIVDNTSITNIIKTPNTNTSQATFTYFPIGTPLYIVLIITNTVTREILSYVITNITTPSVPFIIYGLPSGAKYSLISTTTYENNLNYTTKSSIEFST